MPFMMRRVPTRSGAELPLLGLGTWKMGEDSSRRAAEVAALRAGFDLGMSLVDTAEMYADGGSEEVVGEAIAGRRDSIFVVTKVLPGNASRAGTRRAAERSLRRLGTDRIDLYLLHWPGPHPLAETVEAFEQLASDGKIRHYGVSNFDIDGMEEAMQLPAGERIGANQVLYNLRRRGIERRLLPWCAQREIVVMAYSPFDQMRLPIKRELRDVAERHGATPYQIALAWTLREPFVMAIPKAGSVTHVRENAAAAELRLSQRDLAALERAYPPPSGDVALETA